MRRPGLAAALDRGLCARPELAGLPGRFLFALDDGRGDVAAEEPDLCWQAPGRLLVAGLDTGLHVSAVDAVAVLLDAAEAFLALRAADGESAWRAAELADAPARIAAGLHIRGRRSRSREPGLQQGGPAPIRLQQGHLAATPRTPAPVRAAVPGPVARDDGGVALVVAPLLGELTTAQARLLADAGRRALVVTPWRTVVLPDPQVSACRAGRRRARRRARTGRGRERLRRPSGLREGPRRRPRRRARLAESSASGANLAAGRVHVSGCARRCGAPRGPHVDAVALVGGGYLVDGIARTGLG